MGGLRPQEWLIIIALLALLFGAKRIPEAAKGLGRSLRVFKAETKGLIDGDPQVVTEPEPAAVATEATPAGQGQTSA